MEDSSCMEFKVPMHAIDVELEMPDRFSVEEVWDVQNQSTAAITATMEELGDRLLEDGKAWVNLSTNYVFDKLYSITKHFANVKNGARKALVSVLTGTTAAVLSSDPSAVPAPTRRNAFKMSVFLLSEATYGLCAALPSEPKTAKGPESVIGMLTSAVSTLQDAAKADFGSMWALGVAEEEFVAIFYKAAFKVLETASAMRSKGLKTSAIDTAATALASFPAIVSSSIMSVLHTVQSFDHTPPVVADVLHAVVGKHQDTIIVKEMLREIGNVDVSDSKDSAGMRNLATLLVDISQRIPKAVLSNLGSLLPHLDGEAYPLRSAIVACLGNLASYTADTGAAAADGADGTAAAAAAPASDATEETRELLLDVMQERANDVHAFTRAAVLRAWLKLLNEGGIPVERYHAVTELTVNRLKDKAAIVRKTAMQLLTHLLLSNPFAPKLNIDMFQAQIDEEDKWMAANPDGQTAGNSATPAAGDLSVIQEGDEDEEEEEEEEDTTTTADDDTEGGVEESKETSPDSSSSSSPIASMSDEYKRHAGLRAYCIAALRFTQQMAAAVPVLSQLMGSKNATDAIEAMRFLVSARTFALPGTVSGLQKMLTLIWSSDKSVRTVVLDMFTSLYINRAATSKSGKPTEVAQPPADIAKNLVGVVSGATLAVTTSVEEILHQLCDQGLLGTPVINALWKLVGSEDAPKPTARGAMAVLAMIARTKPAVIDSAIGIKTLTSVMETSFDYRLARHACVALQALAKDDASIARAAAIDTLVNLTLAMIRGDWNVHTEPSDATFYFGAAEEGLAAVFKLAHRPEEPCEQLIRTMTTRLMLDPEADIAHVSRAELSQLFFVVGHVSLKLLLYVESVMSKIKKARSRSTDRAIAEEKKGDEDALEAELGMAAAAEEQDNEWMAEIANKHIIGRNMLGVFGPLLVRVVANEGSRYSDLPDDMLLQSAVLALCKFMTISAEFCAKHLQVLFTVLQNSAQPSLRATISVALGDLASRFPNLIEPWTPYLYARLRDPELRVRKNMLMVLTHLILNDMVKVKGQIAEIAVCLEDEEPRIRDLTRLFFHELSKRGNNPIYNLLPDTLACLSSRDGLDQADFRSIMKYLLAYIQKDKQADSLVDKLCHRFQTTEDSKQWRELAYCLSQLKLSDKGVKNLVEGFRLYKHTLGDPDVFDTMHALAIKAKKTAKPDAKETVEDWEKSIVETHGAPVSKRPVKETELEGDGEGVEDDMHTSVDVASVDITVA